MGAAAPARAEPQASVGLTAGAAVENLAGPTGPGGSLHLGGRADLLFLREGNRTMALGPYLDLATAGFRDLDAGGGLEWLVPLGENVALVPSAGAFARNGAGWSWAPGGEATVFLGSRSYNFHAPYGLASGVFLQARWLPGTGAAAAGSNGTRLDGVVGVQLDLELLALPVLWVWGAIAHGG